RAVIGQLRRVLAELDPQRAIELLLDRTRATSSNAEFLLQIQRSAPAGARNCPGRPPERPGPARALPGNPPAGLAPPSWYWQVRVGLKGLAVAHVSARGAGAGWEVPCRSDLATRRPQAGT